MKNGCAGLQKSTDSPKKQEEAIEIAATQTCVRLRGLGYNGVAFPGFIPSYVLSCHSERSEESGQMLRYTPFHCVPLSMTNSTLDCNLVLV